MKNVLRILFVLVFGFQWFIWGFLLFPARDAAGWFKTILFLTEVPLHLACVAMLLRRQWKNAATIALALGLSVVCSLQVMSATPWVWFVAQGFRIHAWPIERYLQRCELTDFAEAGIKQTVGNCHNCYGVVYAPVAYCIYYDTTGEIAAPLPRRTPEWRDAMYHYQPRDVIRDEERRAYRLFGHFYLLAILHEEEVA